jgi:serine/threonine protein kinase
VGAWSPEVEEQYIEFVESGGAAEYLEVIWNEGTWAVNTLQMETWVHDYCNEFFESETDIYSRLEPLQGKNVPRLLAIVSYQLQRTRNPEYQHLLSAPGIIMEFIDGFPLSQLPSYVSAEHWQTVCDSAVSVIDEIGAYGVLNKDVRPENITVRKAQDGAYQVVCCDFGLGSTRDDFDTEKEWEQAKETQDERGAVGVVMQRELNKWRPGYYKFCRVILE